MVSEGSRDLEGLTAGAAATTEAKPRRPKCRWVRYHWGLNSHRWRSGTHNRVLLKCMMRRNITGGCLRRLVGVHGHRCAMSVLLSSLGEVWLLTLFEGESCGRAFWWRRLVGCVWLQCPAEDATSVKEGVVHDAANH